MRVLMVWGCACALVAGNGWQVARADEPGELLNQVASRDGVATSQLSAEVEAHLKAVRAAAANDFKAAVDQLKQLADYVSVAPELSADVRLKLRGQIENALRSASRRAAEQEVEAQRHYANQAAAHDRQHAVASMDRRQAKLQQLVDRFDAILQESNYSLAEETAAVAATQTAPDSPLSASLPLNARTQRYTHDAQVTRVERQKGVVDTLQRSEIADIPQSDEPPIVYVTPEEWQELTQRRASYSTDMSRETPAEARIRRALDETTHLEFIETPLSDVIDYLKDLHKIEIQLDTKSLEDAGIGSDTAISLNLQGISLRSALKLLLRKIDATYAITNEVLLITTPEVSAAMIVPHVHRVADIVLPIRDMGFRGGFGQLGGGNANGMFGAGTGQNNGPNGLNNQQNNQGPNPFQNGNNLF